MLIPRTGLRLVLRVSKMSGILVNPPPLFETGLRERRLG